MVNTILIKTTVWLLLAAFFFKFYFIDVFETFMKKRTNFATTEEITNGTIAPTLTFCFEPALIPGKLNKHGLPNDFLQFPPTIRNTFFIKSGLDFEGWFEDSSYQLGRDFKMFIDIALNIIHHSDMRNSIELKRGENIVTFDKHYLVDVRPIFTLHDGQCYVVVSNLTIFMTQAYAFFITFNDTILENNDFPESVTMTATSKENYYGTIMNMWRDIEPYIYTMKYENTTNMKFFDFKQKIHKYPVEHSENDNVFTHSSKEMEKYDYTECPRKCLSPILKNFRSLMKNYSTSFAKCETYQEMACMDDLNVMSKVMAKSMESFNKPPTVTEFTAKILKMKMNLNLGSWTEGKYY